MTNSNSTFDIALLDIGEPTEHNIYPDMELNSKTFRYFCCKDGRDLHLIQPGAHYFFREGKKKPQYRYMGVVSKIISQGTERVPDKKGKLIPIGYKDIQIKQVQSSRGLPPLELVPYRPIDKFGRGPGSACYSRDAAYQAGMDEPSSAFRGIIYQKKKPIGIDWTEIDQLPSPKYTTEMDWIDYENKI